MEASLGKDCQVMCKVVLSFEYRPDCQPTRIGDRAIIRSGTVVYGDVKIGDDLRTGHNVLIREHTTIGDNVLIGTNAIVDGHVHIGNNVKVESNVYIPSHTRLGNYVFLGPGAVLTNDKYPQRLRDEYTPRGPALEDSTSVGANATILPGITIGKGSMVAAGSVVTRDVPPWSLAIGVPSRIEPLPERLREQNRAKSW